MSRESLAAMVMVGGKMYASDAPTCHFDFTPANDRTEREAHETTIGR
jgi:hypothetical protein